MVFALENFLLVQNSLPTNQLIFRSQPPFPFLLGQQSFQAKPEKGEVFNNFYSVLCNLAIVEMPSLTIAPVIFVQESENLSGTQLEA